MYLFRFGFSSQLHVHTCIKISTSDFCVFWTDKPKAYNLGDESYLADQRQVATLQCDFKGVPKSVKWFKGREEIPVTEFKESFHTESSLIAFPTHRRSVLTIYYVVDAAFDRYTCVGYNDFGNGSGIVQLRSKCYHKHAKCRDFKSKHSFWKVCMFLCITESKSAQFCFIINLLLSSRRGPFISNSSYIYVYLEYTYTLMPSSVETER